MRNDVISADRLLSQVKGQCKRGYRFGYPFSHETLLDSMIIHNLFFPPFDFP